MQGDLPQERYISVSAFVSLSACLIFVSLSVCLFVFVSLSAGHPIQGDLPQKSYFFCLSVCLCISVSLSAFVSLSAWSLEVTDIDKSFPRDGIVTLPNFLTEDAVSAVVRTLQ